MDSEMTPEQEQLAKVILGKATKLANKSKELLKFYDAFLNYPNELQEFGKKILAREKE